MDRTLKSVFVAVLIFTSAFPLAESARDRAVNEVAKAERDFAGMSLAEGVRASFLANFTEDGIGFGPQPAKMRELFGPPPSDPKALPKTTLDWYPVWTDASRSGDVAFSTGPSITTDHATRKPIRWGNFASVWQRQPDGKWRVVVDIGIQHAEPPASEKKTWRPAPASHFKTASIDVSSESEGLKRVERQFSSGEQSVVDAYSKFLNQESRLHRPGVFPVLGRTPILDHLRRSGGQKVTFEPAFSSVARSGDLGYTYGAYFMQPGDQRGYYAHFWKREKNGDWKLVIDVTNPEDAKN